MSDTPQDHGTAAPPGGGLEETPRTPSDLYWQVRGLMDLEIALLDDMQPKLPPGSTHHRLLRAVWKETLPAALDMHFESVSNPVAVNLYDLEKVVQQ